MNGRPRRRGYPNMAARRRRRTLAAHIIGRSRSRWTGVTDPARQYVRAQAAPGDAWLFRPSLPA